MNEPHRRWEMALDTRIALLALRFWDPVLQSPVSDGLTVTARPLARDGPVLRASAADGGLYLFQRPRGAAQPPETYRIEVWDHQGRYLPVSLALPLPYPEPGLFPPAAPSGPSPPGLTLFAAPTRSGEPGFLALRAQLWNTAAGAPAAHAMLEVTEGARLWHGLADHRGSVAVLLPWPVRREGDASFPITLRVRSPATPSEGPVPELRLVLNQPPGLLRPSQSGPDQQQWTLSVPYNREFTLRTDDLPVLWIAPEPAS